MTCEPSLGYLVVNCVSSLIVTILALTAGFVIGKLYEELRR